MANSEIKGEMGINPSRLEYLLGLYKMNKDELAGLISGKRKRLTGAELSKMVEKKRISIPLLKKIDAKFRKGLNWYAAERKPPESKISSIFFRKDKFNSELNFEARRIASKFEERKFEIQYLCSAIDFKLERKLEQYNVKSDVRTVAKKIRKQFDEIEHSLIERKMLTKRVDDVGRLKAFAAVIERMNVFVFEYLENWNKKERTNFNGFFIQPNVIVIKGQKYRRREIFTLIHEFAHYLLNLEEIDDVEDGSFSKGDVIERWCNDFVYYFLIGDKEDEMGQIEIATQRNDFQKEKIDSIYNATALSKTAIYTRLVIEHKISQVDYEKIVQEINEKINRDNFDKKMRMKEKREFLVEQGKTPPFMARRPLQSLLFKEIVKINYFEGNLDEVGLCDYLNIKMDKIGNEIY